MSIFPKRTTRNSCVTIHWNFNTSRLTGAPIFPLVRIGVRSPAGAVTMLLEEHLLVLPGPADPGPVAAAKVAPAANLPKSTPLLVLASYLSGKRKRQTLVEMLEGMQSGKHYYFTFPVPASAPLGKYTLISEVHLDGQVKHSKTAAEDFFFVEEIQVTPLPGPPDGPGTTRVANLSPEPVPVKIVMYHPGQPLRREDVSVRELAPDSVTELPISGGTPFLLYSEERKMLPLFPPRGPHLLRNQQLLSLHKEENGQPAVYLLGPNEEDAYVLEGKYREIWERADGLSPVSQVCGPDNAREYREMLAADLIREIAV